jgi:DMSO/TMAO reductase YedYZ molybdopterin-dependent catalytic subunit
MTLSLTNIKKMPVTEIVAVTQCSGNSRGFFEPRVAGGQLGNGAMGNARWTGVPLQTVLDKAGIQQGAKQVVFGGLDGPSWRRRQTSPKRSTSITPAMAR